MFAKLLKYEWKANAPLLGVLSAAAVGVGLMGGIAMRVSAIPAEGELGEALSNSFIGLSYTFVMFALMLYVAAVSIILIYRFYKSKFAEQGYLTFTLPVTGHQILLSSLVSMLLWEAIAVITAIASMLIMSLIDSIGREATDAVVSMREIFDDMFFYLNEKELAQLRLTALLTLLQIPVAWVYGNILTMISITIGAAWAKKHKLLASFAIFYGASYLLSFVSGIITAMAAIVGSLEENPFLTVQAGMAANLVIEILLTVGGYFLAHYMMTKKLNLK